MKAAEVRQVDPWLGEEWRYGPIREPSPEILEAARAYLESRRLLSVLYGRHPHGASLIEAARKQLDRCQQSLFDSVHYDRSRFVVDDHLVRVEFHLTFGHPIRVETLRRSSTLAPRRDRRRRA